MATTIVANVRNHFSFVQKDEKSTAQAVALLQMVVSSIQKKKKFYELLGKQKINLTVDYETKSQKIEMTGGEYVKDIYNKLDFEVDSSCTTIHCNDVQLDKKKKLYELLIKTGDRLTIKEVNIPKDLVPGTSEIDKYYLKDMTQKIKGSISINIVTLTDVIYKIGAEPDDTIETVKVKMYYAAIIPPDQQRLIFAGRQLEDYRMLSNYDISDGATLFLVLRLRGGMFHMTSGRMDYEKFKKKYLDNMNDLENEIDWSLIETNEKTLNNYERETLGLLDAIMSQCYE